VWVLPPEPGLVLVAQPLEEWPTLEREQRYPWSEWLDGRPWRISRGEDYDARAKTFVANARAQAKRRGGSVRTRIVDEGSQAEGVILQFRRDG